MNQSGISEEKQGLNNSEMDQQNDPEARESVEYKSYRNTKDFKSHLGIKRKQTFMTLRGNRTQRASKANM